MCNLEWVSFDKHIIEISDKTNLKMIYNSYVSKKHEASGVATQTNKTHTHIHTLTYTHIHTW